MFNGGAYLEFQHDGLQLKRKSTQLSTRPIRLTYEPLPKSIGEKAENQDIGSRGIQ